MSTNNTAAQLQNWDNFCRHHANRDWYGTWTRYSAEVEIIESFNCIRSFKISADGSEIYHQNHYTYADGTKETKTFGPYKKPITRALFLDNSFSWGSHKIELGSNFGFETGLSYEDRRAGVVIMYDEAGNLERIVVIPENLTSFPETPTPPSTKKSIESDQNWKGTAKTITPDCIVSSPVDIYWEQLEKLGDNFRTLHFCDGISVTFPPKIVTTQKFFAAVEWQVNPNLLMRAIRNYDSCDFTSFTLQTFIAQM
ncbi:DUF3598 family protein [Fischerella thermalis]|uniref:DUF3598 family protein n=1 Tax=Fischerella thermalis TaxID=372787 RepID=UPI001A02F336|nr:DUF3598 family protein [Fischerella thermalis]MBF1989301.1 DUF3598 family protein [Fischerella thermalis M58_A2018_009]MBF2060532.1 DUF3598 family protein [Fischerella thermalis M66_A2018_004]MBF2070676.1 DUF3598 family protein [Fischerella thermalis M48_A2018_028]